MLGKAGAVLLAASSWVAAQSPANGSDSFVSNSFKPFSGDPFQKYALSAQGIKASFISYGARLTNLYVKDKNCNWQDVVVGYDNGTQYLKDTETNHTYFGAVVGRYANRYELSRIASQPCPRLTALQNQEWHVHHRWCHEPHPRKRAWRRGHSARRFRRL